MLTIVSLPIDVVACAVQLALESVALAAAEVAVSPRESFIHPDPCLLSFKPFSFASSYCSAANPFANSFLLLMLAIVDTAMVSALRTCGKHQGADEHECTQDGHQYSLHGFLLLDPSRGEPLCVIYDPEGL